MKTRVKKWYHLETGQWVYYVEVLKTDCRHWVSDRSLFPDFGHWEKEPDAWIIWPYGIASYWKTPDEKEARRVACQLSQGRGDIDTASVIVEFADGVEFTVTQ